MSPQEPSKQTKPDWLRVRLSSGENFTRLKRLMREQSLHTVCEEARCPNMGECWEAGTATFMILGDTCTRACGFCAVKTGRPQALDLEEPLRVAVAVQKLGLTHAVVTSVNRDNEPEASAALFAETIRWIRRLSPSTSIEVLVPDFMGKLDALIDVMRARPEILNHNTETVPRLYRTVRPKGRYGRSLELLRRVKEIDADVLSKTGIMVGLGESRSEIVEVLRDLRAIDCDILTIGQYLRPSKQHLPVVRYYPPEEFEEIAAEGRALGFRHVEAGPLVRSSYHAERQISYMIGATAHETARPVSREPAL